MKFKEGDWLAKPEAPHVKVGKVCQVAQNSYDKGHFYAINWPEVSRTNTIGYQIEDIDDRYILWTPEPEADEETKAIELLKSRGYVISKPEASGLTIEFVKASDRKRIKARDLTEQHDAVYWAYDFTNSEYTSVNWPVIFRELKTYSPSTYKLCVSSRLIRDIY